MLGAAGFGACVFLIAVGRWVGLIDLGFHDGSQRLMTQAFDSGDSAKGFSVARTYVRLLLVHAAAGFLVFLLLSQVIHVPEFGRGVDMRGLFLAAGATFAGQYLFFGSCIYFNSRRQFGHLAVSSGVQTLVSAASALALTLWLRVPEAYLAGFAAGNALLAIYNFATASSQSSGVTGVRGFDRDAFGYSLRFGAKLYLTRVCAVVTATFDRILVTNALGAPAVTPYASAARIPEAAQEVLPINLPVLPEITRAQMEGPERFAESVQTNTVTVFAVSCAAILVPCAFAEPLLSVWLGDKYSPEMAWVMLLVGAHGALQMLYTGLAQAMIAHGSPERVLPFTLYNAVVLLALAYPSAVTFGIVGVAGLRLAIHLVQFVPILSFTRRTVVPNVDLGKWLGSLGGTLVVACFFAAGAVLTWQLPSPWISIALVPLFSALFLAVVHFSRLAPMPERVVRRFRGLKKVARSILGSGIWHVLKVALRRDPSFKIDEARPTERFGSDYGGWDVVTGLLNKDSVVYSVGVGGEVSFDLALIERFGVTVHAFDPTPQCVTWVAEQSLPKEFVMHPYGVAAFDGEAKFHPPDDPNHVSHTILDRPDRSAVSVPFKRLVTIMRELGHDRLDLLKMDIEGAEYGVIADMAASKCLPRQVLVEFHHRFPDVGVRKTEEAIRQMKELGYRLVHVTETVEEFTFVRG